MYFNLMKIFFQKIQSILARYHHMQVIIIPERKNGFSFGELYLVKNIEALYLAINNSFTLGGGGGGGE